MTEKTREELIAEIAAKETCLEERKISDARYAIKLVEKIVFTFVGLILIAFAGALISLIIINGGK